MDVSEPSHDAVSIASDDGPQTFFSAGGNPRMLRKDMSARLLPLSIHEVRPLHADTLWPQRSQSTVHIDSAGT